MNKWLTPEDVANLLQVSRSKAYEIISEYIESGGKVWRPTKRITRVEPTEFFKFLEKK
jgi:hypothetical protein